MADPTPFSIATINLNGIRAAFRRGFAQWLEEAKPDVVLMQEVRADEDTATQAMGNAWDSVFHSSTIKGRAGVGVAVRKDSTAVGFNRETGHLRGLAEEEVPVDSGRWVEVLLDTASGQQVRAISAYFHSGEVGTPRQEAKMLHLQALESRFDALMAEAEGLGSHSVVGGDYNVVRSESDIKNWRPNHNKRSGVLDEEIAYLNRWAERGWVDTVRELAGEGPGPYSWWTWRGKAFDNDTGWRIDYHYATPVLGRSAVSYSIGRAASWDKRFSDHAPVTVTYAL